MGRMGMQNGVLSRNGGAAQSHELRPQHDERKAWQPRSGESEAKLMREGRCMGLACRLGLGRRTTTLVYRPSWDLGELRCRLSGARSGAGREGKGRGREERQYQWYGAGEGHGATGWKRRFSVHARPEPNAAFAFGVRALEDASEPEPNPEPKLLVWYLGACMWIKRVSEYCGDLFSTRVDTADQNSILYLAECVRGSGSRSGFGKQYPEPEPNRTLPALNPVVDINIHRLLLCLGMATVTVFTGLTGAAYGTPARTVSNQRWQKRRAVTGGNIAVCTRRHTAVYGR
ncbi:hypothetical protein C8R46DRAFT_1037788 [Mycena filopes]|nr:hypothetical protein C8R46DRAFT_1037788 [Mycena filopes]